jgi:hypothetical protein
VPGEPSGHGNVAFKVTWVYGETGPFASPCTPTGRRINIQRRRVTWCRQPECPCRQLFDAGNTEPYDRDKEYWPCYDSAIFDKWSFGGGRFHGETRKGQKIPFKNFRLGKLAFFTTRRHDMEEEDRVVIGCYRIAKAITDPDFDMLVAAAGDFKLRVRDFDQAPRFWEFHRQKGEPHWGTGLFRYLPDEEASALLEAVQKVAVRVN